MSDETRCRLCRRPMTYAERWLARVHLSLAMGLDAVERAMPVCLPCHEGRRPPAPGDARPSSSTPSA